MGILYEPGRAYAHLRPFIALILLVLPYNALAASDTDLEKDLQSSLTESRTIVDKIEGNEKAGLFISTEISRLKALSEVIRASHLLMGERLRLRDEKVKSLGVKAIERQQNVYDGYKKAIEEYLGLIDSLQPSAISDQQNTLKQIKTLLNKIIIKKKRPIHGTLPYKNLNYPAREPSSAASITPAYKGGNKTIAPEDTQGTEEAPISLEIASLAQTLNWQPVAIYEYVKNNIETEWYYGCMKGAEETLRQKSGNDCDQATLLVALLRASGFPSRYVRGSMEFFAGGRDGKPIERAKNLLGINDPLKIAEYLQKAGIPYKPVISGGQITNFQIEHIWVESLIPYSNYRGIVIDDMGKTWLGLDTSIKVKEYVYNSPQDVFSGQWQVVGGQFTGLRDEYLTTPAAATPLEYLKSRINSELQTQGSQLHYEDFLRSRTLPEEHLGILPARIQHTLIKATNEYNSIPDELVHKVRFTATDTSNNELFTITLPSYKLSNQKIAISYEPETVEDQEIIDSYRGLDNTPSYLIRLRPVLKINVERVVVGKDGLPMGSDYKLAIELISPNGVEKTTSTHIVGNLSVIGIVAQKAPLLPSPLAGEGQGEGEKDAETILYKEAMNYISRWNQAEDELTSLFHLAISRPLPTVVTVGGVIDVTYLLDMPHGFEWKGLFMDAGLRRIETTIGHGLSQMNADLNPAKLFMQLSALQGSVLEHRVFEDDFKVESISTAKLLQISGQGSVVGDQIVTIDKTNITTILPTLPFDESIKEDIINAVNQNYSIRIPQSEIAYQNWSGIGYIKENTQTGEAGYMLSGMIAGGMTAVDKLQWYMQDIAALLSSPYTPAANTDPSNAVRIARLNVTDYQSGTAGKRLSNPFQALALDSDGKPVRGVPVTFTAIAGGGELSGSDENGMSLKGIQITIKTGWNGVAYVYLTLGKHTADSPYYSYAEPYYTRVGHNLISVSAQTGIGTIYTDKPFEAFGYPGDAVKIVRTHGHSDEANNRYFYGLPNTFSNTIALKVTDQYENPVSNKKVTFKVEPQTFQFFNSSIPAPTGEIKNARIFKNLADCPGVPTQDCSKAVYELNGIYTYSSGTLAYVILGNTDNTRYTITANAKKDKDGVETSEDITPLGIFNHYISSVKTSDQMAPPRLRLMSLETVDEKGNLIDAGKPGSEFIKPLIAKMLYTEEDFEVLGSSGSIYLKGKGTFRTIPVSNTGSTDAVVKNGKVEFSILKGGGDVNPAVQTTETNGQYSTTLRLGVNPALNQVLGTGTATGYPPTLNPATGEVTRDMPQTYSASTSFEIWGVKATVEKGQLVLVNDEGYTTADTQIKYVIEPTDYKPQDAFIDFYEKDETGNERWYGFIQADANGNITLSQGGAKFDANNIYKAELILNRGSSVEIRSEKTPLAVGQMKLFTSDQPETEVEGAVTDGVTKVKLRLMLKNWEVLAGTTWGLADPQMDDSQIMVPMADVKGTLLNGEQPVNNLPVNFNADGVAEAIYKVPETFVRFGTYEGTNDYSLAERYVLIKLNSQTSGLPQIRLKRPPVVLVHGLWSEPGTWKTFKSTLNTKAQYNVDEADYSDTNAASLEENYRVIPGKINKILKDIKGQHLAATKVDIVAHSMGGLLVREYCRNNQSCKDQIHKLITIDTPHKGSEAAKVVQSVQGMQNPTSMGLPNFAYDSPLCQALIPLLNKQGMITNAGAIDDLATGSSALQGVNSFHINAPSHAVAGITSAGVIAHDDNLRYLWIGLMVGCGLKSDSSMGVSLNQLPLFSKEVSAFLEEAISAGQTTIETGGKLYTGIRDCVSVTTSSTWQELLTNGANCLDSIVDVPQTIIGNTRDFINAMANGSGIGMPSLWVEGNDRIVPKTSEMGGLTGINTTEISGVDHLNVHQTPTTIDNVKKLLEGNNDHFSLEGF